ncbi:MAG: GrpB family protein [Thermoplasmata archaeon]|nr:GrpB family protein [Thermoplasmata archaeon]
MADPDHPTVLTTEEQLRRVTIGEPRRHDAPIALCEYDPTWPELFSREERRIRKTLGDRAVRLEHVGSTSVPGLVAKPIIDILLVVADSADESSYVSALESEGYVLRIREPEWHQHRLFEGPDTNLNLHVFSRGAMEIDRMLTFRDVLRSNPETRKLYATTKRALARRTWKFVQNYADAKSEVVEGILANASSSSPRK